MIPTYRPALGPEELAAVAEVFESRWLGTGELTRRFEERIIEYLGVKHVIAVNRGTSALHVALDALDLEEGDEVIAPSLTFVATIQAILAAGATPVFCEISPDTLNVDPDDVLARVTARTRAIMPVHYAGMPCDMDRILPFAADHDIRVIEDAAHAFGSNYKGRRIGTLGDITCFSFDAIKAVTCGEGGAVATDDDALASRVARRRNLGIDRDSWTRQNRERFWAYEVVSHGFRYPMSNINAAIGLAQLEKLERFREIKSRIVRRYDEAFSDIDDVVYLERDLEQMFPWAYVVRIMGGGRDRLAEHLRARDIATMVQFIPNHMQPAFRRWSTPLPVTEQLFDEIISLPLYAEMSESDIESVIGAVRAFFGK